MSFKLPVGPDVRWLIHMLVVNVIHYSISFHFVNPGDLWSGSEGGGIKIWPWEAVEKSIHLTKEERHSAVIFVERSYVDLRSQLSTNGFSNMLTSDVKYLVSDNLRAKVWSAGYFSSALW